MTADDCLSAITRSLRAHPKRWTFWLVLLPTLVRLWFVATAQLGLVQDEAQYWDWTRHLQLTYYSKGPLIAWIIWACTRVLGDTELGVRMGSILGSALLPVLIWWLVAKLWKRPVMAVLAVFLIAVAPIFQALGILMTTDNPFVICWTLSIIALYAAATPDDNGHARGWWPYLLLAFAFGIGILAKYTMLGLVGLAALYALLLLRQGMLPKGFLLRTTLALVVGMALGFLPTLIWNMQNDFVGYKHVLSLIGVTGPAAHKTFRLSRVPEYMGAMLGFSLPWWYVLTLVAGWRAARLTLWNTPANREHADGLNYAQASLLSLFFWPMTLFFLAWSFHSKVLANWNAVSFVAAVLLCAAMLERLMTTPRSTGRSRWLTAGFATSLVFFALIHLQQFLPIPTAINPTQKLKGWEDMGQHMAQVAHEQFGDSPVFFFSEVYDITAALAFYVPSQPQTYCLWTTDRRMNQYDMWPGPKAEAGTNAILVRRADTLGPPPGLTSMFARVEGPFQYMATLRGEPVRPFHYFLCYDYNGSWPRHESGNF